jgi:hypothetical protein
VINYFAQQATVRQLLVELQATSPSTAQFGEHRVHATLVDQQSHEGTNTAPTQDM